MLLESIKNSAGQPPYPFPMAAAKDSIRDVLSTNVRNLMKRRRWTQVQLAGKSGISQTHIGNVLRKEVDASTAILAGLGKAFELPDWLLLVPGLPPEILDSKEIPDLLRTYLEAAAQPLSTLIAQRAARKI